MRIPAVPIHARNQFLKVARWERARYTSALTGDLIWGDNWVRQQHVQWMLFYDGR
jgi:hypothetical protein